MEVCLLQFYFINILVSGAELGESHRNRRSTVCGVCDSAKGHLHYLSQAALPIQLSGNIFRQNR